MKVQASKPKQIIAAVLGLVAVILVARALLTGGGGEHEGAAAGTAVKGKAIAAESLDPRLHLDQLANSESVMYEGEGKNIFRSAPEVEIPSVKVPPLLRDQHGKGANGMQNAAMTPPGPPQPPPPPPINLKFFGYSTANGRRPQAFLAQGDEVWIAHEGDVVNRQYKIVHITPTAVEVEDLLNNHRQSLQLTQG